MAIFLMRSTSKAEGKIYMYPAKTLTQNLYKSRAEKTKHLKFAASRD